MRKQTNTIFVRGNLTKDPDLQYTQNGTAICKFAIANNRDYKKDGEEINRVNYFNCQAWGKLGEIIAQHCAKGKEIFINGELIYRSWEDQEGNKRFAVDIQVNEFEFCNGSGNQNNQMSDDDIPMQN